MVAKYHLWWILFLNTLMIVTNFYLWYLSSFGSLSEILSSSVIQYLQWYILFHWSVKEITMIFLSGIKQGHFLNELGCMRIFYIVCYFYLFSITHKHNKLDFLNSYQVNNHTNYRYIMYKSHHSWSLQIL